MKHEAIKILKNFSSLEVAHLRLFIVSPFFKSEPKVCSLCMELLEFYPNFNEEILTKEYLFNKVGIKNECSYRNLFRDVKFLLRQFLIYKYFEEIKDVQHIFVLEEFQARGFAKLFKKESEAYVKLLDNDKKKFTTMELFHKYRYYLADYNQYGSGTKFYNKKDSMTTIEHQNKVGNYLTDFYILESMRDWIQTKWQSDNLSSEIIEESEIKLRTLFEEGNKTEECFKAMIEEEENKSRKIIFNIYFLLYQCFKIESDNSERKQNLTKLIDLIPKAKIFLDHYDIEYIVSVSRNAICRYCDLNPADIQLKYTVNEIYLKEFSKNKQTGISVIAFSRIILGAFIDNKIGWALENRKFLEFTDNECHIFFNTIFDIYEMYSNKNYTEANRILKVRTKSKDIYNKFCLHYMRICLLFEMKDYVKVIDESNNLDQYLDNHKKFISNFHYNSRKQFCKNIVTLSDFRNMPLREKLEELSEKIGLTSNSFIKTKILEIASDYKNRILKKLYSIRVEV